ncbi:MAG: spondin domain-containing protein [Gammaproteobacteria bacterium]|nr:spondin domain-containing protein [Gammaproteobacteria bacterium]
MRYLTIVALLVSLAACNDRDEMKEYSITITNLTHNQPFSPVAGVLHAAGFKAWQTGEVASDALEKLAEGGDASGLLAMQQDSPQYHAAAPLFAGETMTFQLMADSDEQDRLTLATMLINTNDAFSGINAMELDVMGHGHTQVVYGYALDAGTEANTELAGSIPGPADGGEGYNPERNDVTSKVTNHGGVVSQQDGHMDSVLSESHRFDGPVMRVEIKRL